ncbi:Nitrogen permease regulator 3 [Elasticomyces elasticus]|nr:Nitrogen permease regulator 3 [Elasticomyces elasticus]KAK4976313.1 Nitrogen permease regulator 3 [Elasticomyces elasticus]
MVPPSDCKLLAVLLITRSRSGPKLVFYYRAAPTAGVAKQTSDEDDSDIGSEAEHDDVNGEANVHPTKRRSTENGNAERLLGYSIDSLEKLLSPGRWSDKKKFEVCVDGITFIGHPVYARNDGEWSSKSQARREHDLLSGVTSFEQDPSDTANITVTAPGSPSRVPEDYTHVPDSLDSQQMLSLGTSMDSTSTASGMPTEQMAMFHAVFVVRGSQQTYATEIHEHIAKPFSRALHHCQKRYDYVSVQSRKMIALRAKAKQNGTDSTVLLTQIIEHSELAWALKEVCEKVSMGEVAGIRLNGTEISLHIPPAEVEVGAMDEYSALLLLEDKDALLRELSHRDANPLAHFIREHTPTKPLGKLATKVNIPLPDLLHLAQHLIKWRKARSIPPLHSSNAYILHPSAPMDKVAGLIPSYARRFATLPTLPQMLKVLSGKPIKYGMLIPSRDHRAPYMEILAFLHRHGFVTRLQTCGWLRSRPDAKNRSKRERPISGLSLLSPQLRPVDDDAGSVGSEQTVITTLPARDEDDVDDDHAPSQTLILDPADLTPEQSDALTHMIDSLSDVELRERMPQLLKYFDGKHVLEEIAVQEGLKRAKVEDWLATLQAEGHLTTFRAI